MDIYNLNIVELESLAFREIKKIKAAENNLVILENRILELRKNEEVNSQLATHQESSDGTK